MAGKKFKQRKTDVIQDGVVYRLYNTIYGQRYEAYTYTDDLPSNVTLVKKIGDISVVSINKRCFYRSEIQTVNIPEGVVWICEEAFAKCEQLETISLPNTTPIMSTFKLNTYLAISSWCALTYALEPNKPISSEPHQIKRKVLFGGFAKKWWNNSIILTEPLALSYAPVE